MWADVVPHLLEEVHAVLRGAGGGRILCDGVLGQWERELYERGLRQSRESSHRQKRNRDQVWKHVQERNGETRSMDWILFVLRKLFCGNALWNDFALWKKVSKIDKFGTIAPLSFVYIVFNFLKCIFENAFKDFNQALQKHGHSALYECCLSLSPPLSLPLSLSSRHYIFQKTLSHSDMRMQTRCFSGKSLMFMVTTDRTITLPSNDFKFKFVVYANCPGVPKDVIMKSDKGEHFFWGGGAQHKWLFFSHSRGITKLTKLDFHYLS